VVEETIRSNGGVPMMWRTGHSFIKAKAQKEKAKFAGELSGHFFFLDKFYPHDDGCYATLRLLDYLAQTGQTLAEAVSKLPKYISSPEVKVGSPDDLKVALIEKISQELGTDFPEAEVINDERAGDGVRLDMEDSMFVIRYSQNGPYLTIKFEAKTEEKYDELKKYLNKLLHSHSEVNWNYGVNVESLD
jgi:phosphomannomutase